MKKIIFIVLCLLCLMFVGCHGPDTIINSLEKPITVVAISSSGDVILQGSDGKIITIHRRYYVADAIRNTFQPEDIFLK